MLPKSIEKENDPPERGEAGKGQLRYDNDFIKEGWMDASSSTTLSRRSLHITRSRFGIVVVAF